MCIHTYMFLFKKTIVLKIDKSWFKYVYYHMWMLYVWYTHSCLHTHIPGHFLLYNKITGSRKWLPIFKIFSIFHMASIISSLKIFLNWSSNYKCYFILCLIILLLHTMPKITMPKIILPYSFCTIHVVK